MSSPSFVARLRANTRLRDAIILVVMLGAVVALLWITLAPRSARVHFANGLDFPVRIEVGGGPLAVPAGGHVATDLRPGVYDVVVRTVEGRVLESSALHVPNSTDAVAFNVLGAAPIFVAIAVYSASPDPAADPANTTFLGGRHSFAIDDVDYVFTDPPRSISTKSSEKQQKRYVKMIDGGWTVTLSYLASQQKNEEAAALAEAVARAAPTAKAVTYAIDLARSAYGDGASIGLLSAILREHPGNDYVANVLVFVACRIGRCDHARAVLDEVATRTPGTPERALLVGSLSSETDSRRALEEALRTHEADPGVQRRAGRIALIDGRYADCAARYASAERAPDAAADVDDQARCLVALGRIGEAMDVCAAAVKATDAASAMDNGWTAAMTYARVGSLKGAPPGRDPLQFTTRLAKALDPEDHGSMAARDRLWLARPTPGDASREHGAVRDGAKLALAALESPRAAWAAVSESPQGLAVLPDTLLVLLGTELIRAGSTDVGRSVLGAASRVPLSPRAMEDYVLTGAQDARFWRIDPEERAALDFVRARHLDSLGEPSAALYKSARARDIFAGWVTRLDEAWPHPTKGKPADFVIVAARAP